jgi:gliding motility-associated-like protein
LPILSAVGGDTCVGAEIQISAFSNDNIINYQWTPSLGLSNDAIANPIANTLISTTYTVIGSDEFGCSDTTTAYIYIQQEPNEWIVDTTIIIGEYINMDGNDGNSFTYNWTPNTYINCDTCPINYFIPGDDIEYSLLVTDKMGCGFNSENIYTIHVLDLASIDVTDIFTPNGDGDNDKIYVKGWGIKDLIEYSIYNRWGEKIFTTSDINEGWDGTYKGKKQNMDTYAYYVKAIVYIYDEPLTKKGNITLIR